MPSPQGASSPVAVSRASPYRTESQFFSQVLIGNINYSRDLLQRYYLFGPGMYLFDLYERLNSGASPRSEIIPPVELLY